MDGRPAARYDDGTGRVDDDGRVTLTRAHTVRVYVGRSRSRSLTRERASELDDDDAMTIAVRWRRMDGWTNGTRAVYPSVHPSFHPSIDRSIVRWIGPTGLARVDRASRVVDETRRSRCVDR